MSNDRLATLRAAEKHLIREDKVLGKLIKQIGSCDLLPRTGRLFDSLAGSIISQQLSEKAASSIKRRVAEVCGLTRPFAAGMVIQVPVAKFRVAGLSNAKATYIRALAEAVINGNLNLQTLNSLSDDVVVATLSEHPGIGVWTAEMFLIFGLGRLDVFSINDAGLRRAVRLLYGYKSGPTDRQLQKLTMRWAPYRSVASWYLWRSLDGA